MIPAVRVAIGLPLAAFYILGVLLALDMNSTAGQYALLVPVCYLLGSMPWGFLLTYAIKGVDVTRYGSGKTGVANVMRTVGGKMAAIVLVLDGGKGALSMALAWAVADTGEAMVVAGLVAMAGHNWSVFLGFKGGRGVATSLGGLLVMQPVAGAVAMAAFLPVTLASRYFSAGSLTATVIAFVATLVMALMGQSPYIYLLYTGPGGLAIVWLHRDNILRLWHGTERRLGEVAEGLVGSRVGESDLPR